MTRWPDEIYKYIEELTYFDNAVLREMESRARQGQFPIIGPQVGPYLYHYAQLTDATRVFEMGSGYGYSTWYFAKSLKDRGKGKVTHTVWDEELSAEAREWMSKSELINYCEFIVDEAVTALSREEPGIDLIFLDIDKEGYPQALSEIKTKLRPGGILLVDNVLWKGKVVDSSDMSEATLGIIELNQQLYQDPDWEFLINPLRDGLAIARLR